MFATQDRKSELTRNSSITPGDAGIQELEQANQILRDLKAPPKDRDVISKAMVARDSRRGINDVAADVEQTIRTSAEGSALSTGELSNTISLAKVYVIADGSRNENARGEKLINGATPDELKLAAAEANGTRIGDVMPNPIAIENAEKISNASPAAHAIAHGSAHTSTIAEGLAFPMLQSIKESHAQLVCGNSNRAQFGATQSTTQSIHATFERMMAITERLEAEQLAA